MKIRRAIFNTPRSKHEQRPNGPYLVIYPANSCEQSLYANGYFEAAELLIDTLIRRGTHASDDRYVFPILFNLIHSLELHLKLYLEILFQHYKRRSCNSLHSPPSSIRQVLGQHDLRAIVDAILAMIDHKKLHGNQRIRELLPLLEEIDEIGLDAEALRYYESKQMVPHKLLATQRWVYLAELRTSFSTAIDFLKSSYNCDDFYFCERNTFKKSQIDEVDCMVAILESIRRYSGFKAYEEKERHHTGKLEIVSIGDIDGKEFSRYLQWSAEKSALIKGYVRSFDENKLVLANRGIRFGKSHPMTIPDKHWFKSEWDRRKQIEYLSEDFQLVDNAIDRLKKYKSYIESRIKLRG